MTTLRRISALCLLPLALAACESDSSPTELEFEGNREGSVSFSYSGARTGTYAASGKFETDASGVVARVPYAVGLRYFDSVEKESMVNMLSLSPRSARDSDVLSLYLESEVVAGETVSLDVANCLEATRTLKERCGVANFGFSVDLNALEDTDVWQAVSGSLQITQVTRYHLRGTFSATVRNVVTADQINITNGVFEIPVVNEEDAPRFSASPLLSRQGWPGGAR